MRLIGFLFCCFLLIACSGTGTDTPNAIFPTLGRVQLQMAELDNDSIDKQDSSLCLASDGGIICFNSTPTATEDIPNQVSGTQITARIIDGDNNPIDSSLVILAACGKQGQGRPQYEIYSDSLGEFNLVIENTHCFNLEVQAKEGSKSIFAFTDSMFIENNQNLELEMTLPVNIKGTFQIDSFDADQQFLVGLAGTQRSLVLNNGDSFQFADVPLSVKALFFYPFTGDLSDSLVAEKVYNAEHYEIPLNKAHLTDLREIRVDFSSSN